MKRSIFLLAFFIPIALNAQLGKISGTIKKAKGDPAEVHAKKVEKSPASAEIKSVEENLEKLSKTFSRNGDDLVEKKNEEAVIAAKASLDAVKKGIPEIRKKDSKWKIDKLGYEADQKRYSDLYASTKKKLDAVLAKDRQKKFCYEKKDFIRSKLFATRDYKYAGKHWIRRKRALHHEWFHELLEEFDFVGTKAKLDEFAKSSPDIKSNENYQYLRNFYDKDFPEFLKTDLAGVLDRVYTAANDAQERTPQLTYEYLGYLLSFTNDVLSIQPDNQQYKDYQAKFEAKKKELDAWMDKEIFSGPVHKKHAGEVLFSSKKIIVGQEKESDFKTSFKTGESIYGVFYFNQKQNLSKKFSLEFDGKKASPSGHFIGKNEKNDSYFTFAVIPDANDVDHRKHDNEYYALKIIDRLIEGFADGKNHRIGLFGQELSIENASGGVEAWKKTRAAIKKRRVSLLRIPKSEVKLSEAAAQFKKAALKDPFITAVLRVEIYSDSWSYERHKLSGRILKRKARGNAIVKCKDGKCYLIRSRVVQSKGDSSYEAPYLSDYNIAPDDFDNHDGVWYHEGFDGKRFEDGGHSFSQAYEIDCANVNK